MEDFEISARTLVVLMLRAALVYAAVGGLFAVVFHGWGLRRLDPVAAGSTWGFRIVITPGVVLLWPWLARRWMRTGIPSSDDAMRSDAGSLRPSPRALRNAHGWMWRVLAVLAPILIFAAVAYRPRPAVPDVDTLNRIGLTRP